MGNAAAFALFRLEVPCGNGLQSPQDGRSIAARRKISAARPRRRKPRPGRPMSALDQKRTLRSVKPMSALPPEGDIGTQSWNVRFVPKADIRPSIQGNEPL